MLRLDTTPLQKAMGVIHVIEGPEEFYAFIIISENLSEQTSDARA